MFNNIQNKKYKKLKIYIEKCTYISGATNVNVTVKTTTLHDGNTGQIKEEQSRQRHT